MRTLLTPLLGLLILASTSCRQGNEPGHPDTPDTSTTPAPVSTWPATQQTDRGNFKVTIGPGDGTIELNKHFSLAVSVDPTDATASGDPATLVVSANADMPAHGHGMNTQPETVAEGDRGYRVDGMLLHMAGEWVITVTVTGGTGPEQAAFVVLVE